MRQRFLVTLLSTTIYRSDSFVVLSGINPASLGQLQKQVEGDLMSLLDTSSDGAFSSAPIFALGIMPYISISIVMQLLAVAVPYFQEMQREGKSGRKKISIHARYLAVFILLLQAPSYLMNLRYQASQVLTTNTSQTVSMIPAIIILTVDSMLIPRLGERITDKGAGSGTSLVIVIGTTIRPPQAFVQEAGSRLTAINGGGLTMFIVESSIPFDMVCATILLVQGTCKAPVQYAKRLAGNKQYGGACQYISLKLFAANVMSIIPA